MENALDLLVTITSKTAVEEAKHRNENEELLKNNLQLASSLASVRAELASLKRDYSLLLKNFMKARRQRDFYAEKCQQSIDPTHFERTLQENKKLREALRDIQGSLQARADHDQELIGAITTVLTNQN